MPEPVSNLVANLLNSEWFYVILGVWALVSIGHKSERNLLLDRLKDLISKPIITDPDENATSVPFYPRKTFERVAIAVKDALTQIPAQINNSLKKGLNEQYIFVVNPERRWKILGYTINLLFMFFFVWADGIAIANALNSIGLLSSVWEPLRDYSTAVAIGSFFAIVIGALVARDVFSERSDFSDWDEQKGVWKHAAKFLTVTLILLGFVVVIMLGIGRLQSLGRISEPFNTYALNAVSFTTLVIVPLNTVIGTVLIHYEAFKGLLLLLMFIEGITVVFMSGVEYIAGIIGAMGPFTVDVIYRLMLAIVFTFSFFLITPLDLLTGLIPTKNKS